MPYVTKEDEELIEVSRLYYDHNFSQLMIAKKLGISRPAVSRLLQKARDKGIVKIEICDPSDHGTKLENKIKDKFKLKKVIIVPNEGADSKVIKQRLGEAAAKYLDSLLTEDIILGVSWGTTMREVVEYLKPRSIKGMTVVQLNGGVAKAVYDTHASEIAMKIGENYHAITFLMTLPAILDDSYLKKTIINDKNISYQLKLASQASVAMFTVGAFNHESVLVLADYFEPNEVNNLLKKGAVGDICSRIIDENGKICSKELDDRTIGIEIEELRKKEFSIAVAGGKEKLRAIYAALIGKYFNVLITDEWVATEILKLSNN